MLPSILSFGVAAENTQRNLQDTDVDSIQKWLIQGLHSSQNHLQMPEKLFFLTLVLTVAGCKAGSWEMRGVCTGKTSETQHSSWKRLLEHSWRTFCSSLSGSGTKIQSCRSQGPLTSQIWHYYNLGLPVDIMDLVHPFQIFIRTWLWTLNQVAANWPDILAAKIWVDFTEITREASAQEVHWHNLPFRQ